MQIQKYTRLTVFAALAALLTACTGQLGPLFPTPASTLPPPTLQPSPTAVSQATPAAPCSNPLAPAAQGATWAYTTTGAGSPQNFTTTITGVRPDGFTTSVKFADGSSGDQQWACKPEGLLAESLGGGQATLGLPVQGIQLDLATSNATGITLPSSLQPSQTWSYTLDISGSISQGTLAASIAGNVVTLFHSLGTESVTVPAGTFEATRVQAASTFKVAADYYGLSLPITSVVNTTFWFAPGVGWVKAVETGELAATSINTTTELQSFSLP